MGKVDQRFTLRSPRRLAAASREDDVVPSTMLRHSGLLISRPAGPDRGSAAVELLMPAVVLRSGLPATMNVVDVYEAGGPTIAFSSRDLRAPGIANAIEAARRAGFACVVRSPGGRMVAYDRGAVVVDHIVALPAAGESGRDVFARNAAQHLRVLQRLCRVDLRIGEVSEEYCPGEFSINVGGVAKVVGSAQRVTAGAALFSTVIQVVVPDRVREVLLEVSEALGYPLRASSIAGLADFEPSLEAASVAEALRADYRARLGLADGPWPDVLSAHVASIETQAVSIFEVDDWARAHPLAPGDLQSLWL